MIADLIAGPIGRIAVLLILFELYALSTQAKGNDMPKVATISERYWLLQKAHPWIRWPVGLFFVWLALHFSFGLNAPEWAGGPF